jgi:hypothetical protein
MKLRTIWLKSFLKAIRSMPEVEQKVPSNTGRNEEITYLRSSKTLFKMGCMLSLRNLTLQEG